MKVFLVCSMAPPAKYFIREICNRELPGMDSLLLTKDGGRKHLAADGIANMRHECSHRGDIPGAWVVHANPAIPTVHNLHTGYQYGVL